MGLLDTVNGRVKENEAPKQKSKEYCFCEYIDIGVGMQRVTEEPDCPQHGRGELVALIVTTESGSYVLDLEKETAIRSPRKDIDATDVYAADLRRDNEEVKIISLITLKMDEPMVMVLDIREDGIETLRTTTNVQNVTEIYESDKPNVRK
jgi:hypothetical protein